MFAAFLGAFLLELLSRLEQDPMDVIQDILIYQTLMMRNASLGPYVPSTFSPPGYIVAVNTPFYTNLGLMLLAAFIAILIQNWVREFDRGLQGMSIPEQRVKTREFRYQGLVHWKLSDGSMKQHSSRLATRLCYCVLDPRTPPAPPVELRAGR